MVYNRKLCKTQRQLRQKGELSQSTRQQPNERATPISGEVLGRHVKKIRWTVGSVLGRNSYLNEEKYFALEEQFK